MFNVHSCQREKLNQLGARKIKQNKTSNQVDEATKWAYTVSVKGTDKDHSNQF